MINDFLYVIYLDISGYFKLQYTYLQCIVVTFVSLSDSIFAHVFYRAYCIIYSLCLLYYIYRVNNDSICYNEELKPEILVV